MRVFRFPAGLSMAALVVSLSAFSSPAGQLSQGLRDSLLQVSDSLFAVHRSDYMVIDALRDGYIEFDKSFSISYDSVMYTVNGQALPPEVAGRYLRKYHDFRFYGGDLHPSIGTGSITSGGWTKQSVLDVSSGFRKQLSFKAQMEDHDATTRDFQKILEEMYRDGVMTDSANYDLSYGPQGLLMNYMVLSPEMDAKYRMLFRVVMGIQPQKGKWGYSAHSRGGVPAINSLPGK